MFSDRFARWALPVLLMAASSRVGAQATTTSLGTYLICRTTPGAASCYELGLTTAARVNGAGVRNGTTGVVSVQSLQGAAVTLPGGSILAASSAVTVLFEISFFTPGCLPGLPCGPGDYFTGMAFGTTINATTTASASGSVVGTPGRWQGTADLAHSGESRLTFSAPTRFVNPNSVYDGLGGCNSGLVSATNFTNVLANTAVRTCDAQGATGVVQMAFETNAIFDPTYFWAANLRFYGELVGRTGEPDRPGIADSFYCGVSANRRGEVLRGGGGVNCGGYAVPDAPPVGVVPEPATVALMGAGLLGVLAIGRRRRAGAATA